MLARSAGLTESHMAQKDLQISNLLDYYSALLDEKHRTAVEYYYNDDLSLAEIGELMGMTRQGARSLIQSGKDALLGFEEALHLAKKLESADALCERALSLCGESDAIAEIIREIQRELQ